MGFADSIKEYVSKLETKHYYMIGGAAAVIIIIIVLLAILSAFPGERFGDTYHGGEVARFVFDKSGLRLASSELNSQAKVFIWELSSGKLLQTVDGNKKDSRMIAFAQEGKVLVTVGLDEYAHFWDIGTGSPRREIKNIPLSAISALSPDGTYLAYCKGPKTFVWNLMLNPKEADDVFDGSVTSERAMAFSPNSKLLVMGDSSGVLRFYEPEKKSLKGSPKKCHESAIACVTFGPKGNYIGTASRDHTAKLWDTKTWETEDKERVAFKGHEDAVEVIAVGPEARVVLTGSRDRSARLWEGKSGRELFKFENFRGTSESMLAISADGSLVAIETEGGGVEVFDTQSGTSLRKFEVPVSVFTFAPGSNTLFCGLANGKIYTWTKGMK